MRILIATMQRVPYAAMAVLGLSLAATILFFEIKMGLLALLSGFGQQVLTGCLLLGLLGYQWVLFAKRVRKDNSHMRQNLTIGTAQEVIDQIKRYEDLGYDEFAFWIDSGMSFERKRESLARFINDVMPAFQ